MTTLSLTNVTKHYGPQTVLDGATLDLNLDERVGLVGANGSGKTTLLKMITSETAPDSGTVWIAPGVEIGYLAQSIRHTPGQTLAEMIAAAHDRLYRLEAEMRALEGQMGETDGAALDVVLRRYGDISEQFERAGGYALDWRVDEVLAGLGVDHLPRSQSFATLSGGEKARVGMALLLLRAPDVLLLDEPTNHLDAASLRWLEATLRAYRGGMLIVSHDREFLNQTVNVIVEIDEHTRRTRRYKGNYDGYLRAKALERRRWEQEYAAQQEEIKALRLEVKVTARRNDHYRAQSDGDKLLLKKRIETHANTVSKRIRSAEEKLRRIEADPIPEPPEPLRFTPEFDPAALQARLPMVVSGICKRYGERVILQEVHFALNAHSRVVLVGPNGAGKSTLLRLLIGAETPDAGEIRFSPAVRIGYLDQEQRTLDPQQAAFAAFCDGLPDHEQALMSLLLRSGLFRYAELEKRVGQLSVGQQRKLQIARLIAERANLLILDEPTNHVSFDVLEALEAALMTFPGPIIAASHDRRFIEKFAGAPGGEVWEVRGGQVHTSLMQAGQHTLKQA